MNNEELRQALNVIKFQIQQAFTDAADAAGREMTMAEDLRMVELMGMLSNAQACLEANTAQADVMAALGQLDAWDKAFENRGAPQADAMFGPRAYALEV